MTSCDFLLFLCLIAPNHQVSTLSKSSSRKLQVSKSMRERERERENRKRAMSVRKKLNEKNITIWSSEAFLLMWLLFSSFSIIFLQFPPHMQLVIFQLPFLLNFIILINKYVQKYFFLFNALAIPFFNFLSHEKPCEHSH